MKKIKQIAEFAKMYKFNIPVEKHFEYYIETLSQSTEFQNIKALVDEFADFEEWLAINDFNNVGHYKMNFAYNTLKNHIGSSKAYERCLQFDYSNTKFYEKDYLKLYEGDCFLSIDFSSANYQTVKIFDHENELMDSWENLCNHLNIHPMVEKSKSFRQVVFGNLNPKRFQKISHYYILKLVDELKSIFPEDNIIFISHDEIVFRLSDSEEIAKERCYQILDILALLEIKRNALLEPWLNVKITPYKTSRISKGIYVKDIYSLDENELFCTPKYKTLFGCPGNLYYINFKKYVLAKDVEELDCLFTLDEKLAKWII
jgi:hypothetical protein